MNYIVCPQHLGLGKKTVERCTTHAVVSMFYRGDGRLIDRPAVSMFLHLYCIRHRGIVFASASCLPMTGFMHGFVSWLLHSLYNTGQALNLPSKTRHLMLRLVACAVTRHRVQDINKARVATVQLVWVDSDQWTWGK